MDIPVCPVAWRQGVVEDQMWTDEQFARDYDQSVDDYRTDASSRLAELFSDCELRIRLRPSDLARWLKTGRYLTYHASGSTNGHPNLEIRRVVEDKVMGVPLDASDEARPHYGYVRGSAEDAAINGYGPVMARLTEDLFEQTTVMLGDSVGSTHEAGWESAAPMPLAATDLLSRFTNADVKRATRLAEACDTRFQFAEVQIYGPLHLEHIKQVVFCAGVGADAELRQLLDNTSVEWDEIDGFLP